MLQEIQLNNFAIIDQLSLTLQSGMTVITGETGAGKSIIIDAIELALGGRLDTKLVANNQERCDIALCFDLSTNKLAQNWLVSHELATDDYQCIIRRVINVDGKSRCYINGQPMTLQNITELSHFLLSIHGQHQHQALLKRDEQRYLLDNYAGLINLSVQVKQIYQQWCQLHEKITQLQNSTREQNTKRDFLNFQLAELSKLDLGPNELTQLADELKQLANADTLTSQYQQALDYLSEQEGNCVLDLLHNTIRALSSSKINHAKLESCVELLNASAMQIEEVRTELRQFLADVENNPERLQAVEQRLAAIHEVARKHRTDATQLILLQQQLTNELNELTTCEEQLEAAQAELAQIEQQYIAIAEKLSTGRKKTAATLSRLVTENMHSLGMAGGKFAIELTPNNNADKAPQAHGLERCEFLVSANPGQPLQPLNKVASGGELSRISLALQVIIADKVATPTLIFDEVDVGVGGKTAAIIGRMLHDIGKAAQVICITHHAQVAAFGNQHLSVSKSSNKKTTTTRIDQLDENNKIEEIARMLGGIEVTEQTRAHAREMVESCDGI